MSDKAEGVDVDMNGGEMLLTIHEIEQQIMVPTEIPEELEGSMVPLEWLMHVAKALHGERT